MILRLLLVLAIAAVGAAGAYAWLERRPTGDDLPPIRQEDPEPGSPPVVWISGTVDAIASDRLEIREGEGPTVTVHRFAEDATRFFVPSPGRWRAVRSPAVESIRPGRPACVEALLDGDRLLGLRVLLDTRCAPVP